MADKRETEPQKRPDHRVEHQGSVAEIYDFNGMLEEASSNRISVYRRADFDVPIESAEVIVGRVQLPSGDEHGFEYTAEIKLDETSRDPQETKNALYYVYSLTDIRGNPDRIGDKTLQFTGFNNCYKVTGKSGFRALIWIADTKVVISNNLTLSGKDKGEDISFKVQPSPEGTSDDLIIFSDFLQIFMDATNAVSAEQNIRGYERKHLRRTFPIGLQRAPVRSKHVNEGPEPKPKTRKQSKTEEFEPKHSSEILTLDDVIVPEHIKRSLKEVVTSFKHPDVMSKWGAERPQGILLYGEPGTGKTMLVHAIASELEAEIMEIKGGDLYHKWLGDSEKKMQEIFDTAKKAEGPLVVFFDEFESVVGITSDPSAGGADNARNAVAGIFKVEMNSLRKQNPNVLVVGVTNFPDRVDESLIRSGRIDLKFYIPMPDEEARKKIIEGIIKKSPSDADDAFKVYADDLDPQGLARISETLSGADLDEVFRRLKFRKAMLEASEAEKLPNEQAPVKPITYGELAGEIAVFMQNKTSR